MTVKEPTKTSKKKQKVTNPLVDLHPKLPGHDDATFHAEEKVVKTLSRKASHYSIDVDILKEIYRRGYNSWKPNPKNLTKEQVAFGRVNSFLNEGKAIELDADLYEKVTNEKQLAEKFYNIVVKVGQLDTKNLMVLKSKDEANAYVTGHKLYARRNGHVRLNNIKNKVQQNLDKQSQKESYVWKKKDQFAKHERAPVSKGSFATAAAHNFIAIGTAPEGIPNHLASPTHDMVKVKDNSHDNTKRHHPLGDYSKNQKAGARGPTPAAKNKAAAAKFKNLKAPAETEKAGEAPRQTKMDISVKDQKGYGNSPSRQRKAGDKAAANKIIKLASKRFHNVIPPNRETVQGRFGTKPPVAGNATGKQLDVHKASITGSSKPKMARSDGFYKMNKHDDGSFSPQHHAPISGVDALSHMKGGGHVAYRAKNGWLSTSATANRHSPILRGWLSKGTQPKVHDDGHPDTHKAALNVKGPTPNNVPAPASDGENKNKVNTIKKAAKLKKPAKSTAFGNKTPGFMDKPTPMPAKKPRSKVSGSAPIKEDLNQLDENKNKPPESHKEFDRRLRKMKFVNRGGTNHDEYYHETTGTKVHVPRHKIIPVGTAMKIWKQAKAAVPEMHEERSAEQLLSTFRRILNNK